MNPIILSLVISRLRQIANTPNITLVPFDANESSKIREDILTIANSIEKDDPQLSAQLIRAKEILFNSNTFGQAILNPFALGEIIFGLDYIEAKQYKQANTPDSDNNIWSFIHPLIKKSSKQLFENKHFANAAEDAFIEFG
ncbi:MAG: hypothetical protein IKG80_05550, partial [Clostridia bacterium]|nr:hypothetical protein [Clostridia bacterium]